MGPAPRQSIIVPPELSGASLAGGLRRLYGVSWSKARAWVERGKITVDGTTCTDGGRRLKGGEEIILCMNAPRRDSELGAMAAAVVYLDTHLVVVNKPAGISTVPFEEGERGTLVQLVTRDLCRRERRSLADSDVKVAGRDLGIVHRLDRETSGLLVFARSWPAKDSLARQFREHTVRRRYLAVAHGHLESCTLQSHLLRDRGDGLRGSLERLSVGRRRTAGQGRLAVTHVEVLELFPGATLVACRLETGRTHQIRIHLSEAGHPLLGERAYVRDYHGPVLPAPRLLLHAAELGFVHPASHEPMRWEEPPPADMAVFLEGLRRKR
jgi:23S rRNA pseudouridine1911/1915/1917 synthase